MAWLAFGLMTIAFIVRLYERVVCSKGTASDAISSIIASAMDAGIAVCLYLWASGVRP